MEEEAKDKEGKRREGKARLGIKVYVYGIARSGFPQLMSKWTMITVCNGLRPQS